MTPHDALWNYNDPAATAAKFREVLANLSLAENRSEYLQMQTQIARTQSLQRKFEEAHALLDEVEPRLSKDTVHIEHVRYELERGRTYNSSGRKDDAKRHFDTALMQAKHLSADFYTIDALHMLAIVAPPDESIALNTKAIAVAESSSDERVRGWLGALYNNTGWSVFGKGDYIQALDIFERALAWRVSKKQERETQIATWCVARTLRALGRTDEALAMQLALYEAGITADRKDGYVYEELAELYHAQNDARSADFARTAYELLNADAWFRENESSRLERLKSL